MNLVIMSAHLPPILGSKRTMTVVEQFTDLFRTTHKVKTQQVDRSRGERCGDISSWPTLPRLTLLGMSHWSSLRLPRYVTTVLIIINVPLTLSFMTTVPRTSGLLHFELVRILFLQTHTGETDRFLLIQLAETNHDMFHFFHETFYSKLKSKLGKSSPRLYTCKS
jgi:hypothetical protein